MHVAILMDGNLAWASRRGLAPIAGFGEGVKAIRRSIHTAVRRGVATMTLYALSSRDWGGIAAASRQASGGLLMETLCRMEHCVEMNVIGRRDTLCGTVLPPPGKRGERIAGGRPRMQLRLVVDYSSHDSLVRAAFRPGSGSGLDAEEFFALLKELDRSAVAAGPVDLLIRTGSPARLSDFMLWETAHAEVLSTGLQWPDFDPLRLRSALDAYRARRQSGLMADSTACSEENAPGDARQ